MEKIRKFILFGILNFGALALGGWLMGEGPGAEWYQALNKAPWTPPGWVFGVAWTFIMICFTIYMGLLWDATNKSKSVIFFFSIQWFLNVLWNPVFFHFHQVLIGLVTIVLLTGLVSIFLFGYWPKLKDKSLWIAPYFVWLLIATSLNAYIFFNN